MTMARYRVFVDVCELTSEPNRDPVTSAQLEEAQKAMVSAARLVFGGTQAKTVKVEPIKRGREGAAFHTHDGNNDCSACYRMAEDGKGQDSDELFPPKPVIAMPT